jgi:hypothetical protein
MLKRGAVVFSENVAPDFDLIAGADADNERIERSMVNCAHGNPVRHHRLAALRILFDVGGIQQFRMAETTQGALAPYAASTRRRKSGW